MMQSPAPASSLAEPPPAARPQLGRWICQQGLRSARIRGLLLVLAGASAAAADAAAASTTTALPCLFSFGHISYWYDEILTGYPINVYVYVLRFCRTWVLIRPFVAFIAAPCSAARVCGLACFTWWTLMDDNTPE